MSVSQPLSLTSCDAVMLTPVARDEMVSPALRRPRLWIRPVLPHTQPELLVRGGRFCARSQAADPHRAQDPGRRFVVHSVLLRLVCIEVGACASHVQQAQCVCMCGCCRMDRRAAKGKRPRPVEFPRPPPLIMLNDTDQNFVVSAARQVRVVPAFRQRLHRRLRLLERTSMARRGRAACRCRHHRKAAQTSSTRTQGLEARAEALRPRRSRWHHGRRRQVLEQQW